MFAIALLQACVPYSNTENASVKPEHPRFLRSVDYSKAAADVADVAIGNP